MWSEFANGFHQTNSVTAIAKHKFCRTKFKPHGTVRLWAENRQLLAWFNGETPAVLRQTNVVGNCLGQAQLFGTTIGVREVEASAGLASKGATREWPWKSGGLQGVGRSVDAQTSRYKGASIACACLAIELGPVEGGSALLGFELEIAPRVGAEMEVAVEADRKCILILLKRESVNL